MNDTFKEKDLTLTALYKDKVLHLRHSPFNNWLFLFWSL